MSRLNRQKSTKARPRDPVKEGILRDLSQRFGGAGFLVRRERLKTGPGWKAVSGSCRAADTQFIFVDSRLTQDEQIEFLKSKAIELGIVL